MKKFLSVLLAVVMFVSAVPMLCVTAFAVNGTTYYVDSENGNDTNNGLTPITAFKSLAKINTMTFSAGDTILLKAGEEFLSPFVPQGNGTQSNPITISSYGTGEKPLVKSEDGYVLTIVNISHWVIDGLSFTAPNARGIAVESVGDNAITEDITIDNCYIYDISLENDSTHAAGISIDSNGYHSKVKGLHVNNTTIDNMFWGIHSVGCSVERTSSNYESPELSYNSDILFENLIIKNAKNGGIVIGSMVNSTVRYCRILDCATANDSAHAALWMHHCDNILVEYCEIAGSRNRQDGMTIDFDGWSTNSTYDHIYSHDNNRFIKNCVFDYKTKNAGNKVTNCVSVNDNDMINLSAVTLISTSCPSYSFMHDFTFSGNTLVNATPILWLFTPGVTTDGNEYVGDVFNLILHKIFNMLGMTTGDTYKMSDTDNVNAKIAEITSKLPAYDV